MSKSLPVAIPPNSPYNQIVRMTPEILQQLVRIVGSESVSADAAMLTLLSRTTLPDGTLAAAVVRAACREHVQEIMKIASANRIPVYPFSAGKNWGYGDACAPISGCLLLDLSRMNRVLEVNVDLAYAVIEPGVTQGQLFDYLTQQKIPLIMDGNGAGPEASLVGNILDRGFGHSRYGDRYSKACNFEAVLSDGTVVNTGFGAYTGARAQHVYKQGLGPALDGLFTQSNLAVVTRMTLWLMPRPEHINYVFIGLKTPEAIGMLVDRFRPLYLSGTLRSTIHCANDRRLLAGATGFPWDKADGRQALEIQRPDVIASLYKQFGVRAWSLAGVLTGSRCEVAAARKALHKALKGASGIDTFFVIGPRLNALSRSLYKMLKRFRLFTSLLLDLEKVHWLIDLFGGQPSYSTLKGAHWRSRKIPGVSQNPLDSEAGLIWINGVLPMTSDDVESLHAIAEPIFREFGFEFQTTVSFINERSLCSLMSICFDHQSAEETTRARQCEKKLLATLCEKGYLPYRASVAQQKQLASMMPGTRGAAQRIKKALDPEGIIAPGRYIATDSI
jgi:4-cresol dehydrogenase (hydroxylating) flavoprotein subunit